MTLKDILRECNCKYAKLNKVDEKEYIDTTRYVVCKLHNCTTDINHCQRCKERQSADTH